MRSAILVTAATAALLILAGSAKAQTCVRDWTGSIKCSDGQSLSPTWSGGYKSNRGTTWNQSQFDNGWNNSSGGAIRQNLFGNYTTNGGSTWSQTPLDNGLRSSTGRTCARTLLDNVVCR
jgi:hypothetical protein